MKKLILIFAAALFLMTSCNSTKKNLQHGNYDEIISKSVKKLIKKPDNNKEAILLDRAYKLANERDLEAVKFLKLDGQPESWDKILRHYEMLSNRQKQLKAILPMKLNGELINYKQIDYNSEIIDAKRKAAAYFYANGKRLFTSPDKLLIRQAFGEFMKAKSYAGSSYSDLDNLIREAKYKGISRVFVEIESDWVQYFFKQVDEQIKYDYWALVKIKKVQVSPDDMKSIDRIYKKNVEDGFEYVLDTKGNVKKDSVGNDMKRIKYKVLQCALVETVQHKAAKLEGEIEFIELNIEIMTAKI